MWRAPDTNDDSKCTKLNERTPGTHFISIPIALGSQGTQRSFEAFREAILTDFDLDCCKDH